MIVLETRTFFFCLYSKIKFQSCDIFLFVISKRRKVLMELTEDPQPARSQNLWKYLVHGFLLEDLERNIDPLTDSDEYGKYCIKNKL